MELTEKEWHIIQPILPELPTGKRGRPWRGNREVLSGILWILRTGAPLERFAKDVSPVSNVSSAFSAVVPGMGR